MSWVTHNKAKNKLIITVIQ